MRGVMEAGADSSVTQRGYRGVEAGVSDTSSAQGQGRKTCGLADGETGEEGDEALEGRDMLLLGLNVCCMFVFTCMMLCVGINVMTDPPRLLELFICNQLIIGLTTDISFEVNGETSPES